MFDSSPLVTASIEGCPVGDAIGGHAHGAGGSSHHSHHSWTSGGGSSWSSGGGGSFHHSWATGGSWNHSFNHSFNMSFNHSWSSGGGSFHHSWSTGGAFNHSFNVSFNHSPVLHPSSSIKHNLGSSVATTDVGHSVLDLVSITTQRKHIDLFHSYSRRLSLHGHISHIGCSSPERPKFQAFTN